MAALFVIEERDRHGVGLARSGLMRDEADRQRDALAAAYPAARYAVQPQRTTGRGKSRRVVYPTA